MTASVFAPKIPLTLLARQLERGDVSSRQLTEIALARIEAQGGNGNAAFIAVDPEGALAQADAADANRRAGFRVSPIAGMPVSVKDLFDIAGQRTRAGSRLLDQAPPATRDALAVARLRQAGAVLIGRSNMSEFAFSAMGLNPHFGSPISPWRIEERRVAGGSSSGAAASVAFGMAAVGLGTDTGGSIRIPAAFAGLTGFKPTASRVPTTGGIPLSPTLDSFGPIAPTVACCVLIDHILSGAEPVTLPLLPSRSLAGVRLARLATLMESDMDPVVANAYDGALSRLSAAGAVITPLTFPALDTLPAVNRFGFSPIEAWWYHREQVAQHAALYDPRILSRVKRGELATAADYLDLLAARRSMIAAAAETFDGYDAILMPTVPLLPPRIADIEKDDAAFFAANALALRNTSVFNFLDGCALTIPLPAEDQAPVGLTVAGLAHSDARVLSIGRAVESALA